MRSTWHNLRQKAANEIDTFKQLLYMDSDEESRAPDTVPPEGRSQWTREPQNDAATTSAAPMEQYQTPNQTSLESSEQRMMMIHSIGEDTTGCNPDFLEDFTSNLISQYEDGLQPGRANHLAKSMSRASSVSGSAGTRQGSVKELDFTHGAADFSADTITNVEATASSIATSSRLYTLYKMCSTLEALWTDIEGRVCDSTGCSMYIQPLQRPTSWQECKSVHNEHTEKILSWLERSFHTMGVLAHILGIGDARVLTSPSVLMDSLNGGYSNGHGNLQGPPEETPGEYMRLIKFITKLQADYDRRLQKLQVTQDSALLKATKATDLEKQVEALQERIENLERELQEKNNDVKELTDSLHSANTVKTQLVQKNEQLIASNQRLLMTKSEFIDKDTVCQMIQQYYDQDRSGGQHREDIIRLLESMLGIEPLNQANQKPAQTDARSLANQFIEFLDDEAP